MPSKEERIRKFARFAGRFTAGDVSKALDIGNAGSVSRLLRGMPEIRVVDNTKSWEHRSFTYEWVGP